MKQFLHLWVPIFLSNAIIMLSSLFDVIFLSHFSPQHVAALAVCLSVYSLCFVTGIGVLQGMMQELAEANGRQDYADIQRIVKQSILGGVSKSMLKQSRLNFDKIEKCE